jgi:septum formation inhibitor-activating ATPase MinD
MGSAYQTPMEWEAFASPEEWFDISLYSSFSVMIVSDRLFTFYALEEWLKELQIQAPELKIIVLLSNYHDAAINDAYLKLCSKLQVDCILPGRGSAAIVQRIQDFIEGDRKEGASHSKSLGKLVCFVGSTPNIGTTISAFGTALALAQETSNRIGYLCLNLKSSKLHRYLGRDSHAFTLDGLRAELKAQSLTGDRLVQVCETLPEAPALSILYGNMLREQSDFFTPEEIEHLLRAAREAFDLCIVDVNAYWDNAATVCGILQSDLRVVATTSDIAQFQEDVSKWIGQVGSVFGLQAADFELIAVQMDKHKQSEGLTVKDIRKETQMRCIGLIHRHAEAVHYLNQGKLVDLLQQGQPIRAEVSSIVQRLIDSQGLNRKMLPSKEPWLKRLLTSAAAV